MGLVTLQFETAGLFTTLQDFGRTGLQQFGVPSGGAMDRLSAAIANRLVGNCDEARLFEFTLLGPSLRFDTPCHIALTGGDLGGRINGVSIPMWQTIDVDHDSTLTFANRVCGCRAYLAIAGEIQALSWLGSVSPVLSGSPELRLNSVVTQGQIFEVQAPANTPSTKIAADSIRPMLPKADAPTILPVTQGPEWSWFSAEEQRLFAESLFRIGPESNRMAYRLGTFPTTGMKRKQLISSGVTPGTIQVTPSGDAILLMRDAQTTGGYPRIAVVDFDAINTAAQICPGELVRFDFND